MARFCSRLVQAGMLSCVLAYSASGLGGEDVALLPVKLPRHVEIQLPKGWTLLSEAQSRGREVTLDAATDITRHASGGDRLNLLHAVSNPSGPYAAVVINSIQPPGVSFRQVRKFDEDMLKAFGAGFERLIRDSLRKSGRQLLSITSPRLETVGGWPAIAISYTRSGDQGTIYVQHFDIYTPDQELLLILACRDAGRGTWLPVLERITKSLVAGEN